MADPTNIISVLQGYAKPSRPVEDGIPAYGLSLGGAPALASLPDVVGKYALSFLSGILVGALIALRLRK